MVFCFLPSFNLLSLCCPLLTLFHYHICPSVHYSATTSLKPPLQYASSLVFTEFNASLLSNALPPSHMHLFLHGITTSTFSPWLSKVHASASFYYFLKCYIIYLLFVPQKWPYCTYISLVKVKWLISWCYLSLSVHLLKWGRWSSDN